MRCPVCGADNPQNNRFCGDCGNMIVPVIPAEPVRNASVVPKPPYQVKVNVLCLAGAILGILALFMPWALVHDSFLDETTNVGAFDFDESFQGSATFSDNFQFTVILFMIGTLVAFLLPLGGILQIIGSVGFILTTVTYPEIGDDEVIFWVGAAIAIISSVLVLIGLTYPEGIGFEKGKRTAMERLLTVSLFR